MQKVPDCQLWRQKSSIYLQHGYGMGSGRTSFSTDMVTWTPPEARGKFRLQNQPALGPVCQDRPQQPQLCQWLLQYRNSSAARVTRLSNPLQTGLLKSNSLYNIVVITNVGYFLSEHRISLLLLLHLSGMFGNTMQYSGSVILLILY